MKTMMHKRLPLVLTGALMLSLVLTACGGSSQQSGPQAASQGDRPAAPAEGPAAQAEAKFLALSKEIDKLGKGEQVDMVWLAQKLNEILALNPTHDAAAFNLAVIKEKNGDVDTARKVYEQINERSPDFAPASENLAYYLVKAGEGQRAVAIYRQNIKNDPKNVTSRLGLARLLANEKQHEEAITLCRQALQQQADAIEAFRVLANSYAALGNTPMAELIIGRGLKVDKEDVELHYLMAQLLLNKKELAAGVNKLKEVVKMDPKRLKVRAQLADIALTYRDFGNAAQQFEAILKEQPTHRGAMIGLGVSYKGTGRYEQAEKIYQQVLQKTPNDADALWNVAVIYHRHLNKFDDAIGMYERYKAAAPSGDEKAGEVEKLVADIQKEKSNIAAQKEREEREKKKIAAIEATCEAVREGKKASPEQIGNDQERTEVGWQLMVNAQATIEQGGDFAAAEGLVKCAFAVIPDTESAKVEVCAPMRNNWTNILYQLNRLEDALANNQETLKCSPNDPDAQAIDGQLKELIAQAKAAGAQAPAPEGAPAPGTAPAPEGGTAATPETAP